MKMPLKRGWSRYARLRPKTPGRDRTYIYTLWTQPWHLWFRAYLYCRWTKMLEKAPWFHWWDRLMGRTWRRRYPDNDVRSMDSRTQFVLMRDYYFNKQRVRLGDAEVSHEIWETVKGHDD